MAYMRCGLMYFMTKNSLPYTCNDENILLLLQSSPKSAVISVVVNFQEKEAIGCLHFLDELLKHIQHLKLHPRCQ